MKTSNITLMRSALAGALLLGTIGDAVAQAQKGEPVRFHYLKSVTSGERSALSSECDGTTASPEITCRFTQLMVSYQLDPKDVVAETEKRLAQLRTEARKDLKKFTDQLCGDVRKNRAEVERKYQEIKNPHALQRVKDLIALCANPTMSALEGWIRRSTLAESKTCKVSHFQNDPVSYKKVGPNKWVANVGPQGICSSVYLYTMENDPKHANLWKWSQVRTYADTSGELCKSLQLNYKLEYSWQGDEVAMTCENIKFGL